MEITSTHIFLGMIFGVIIIAVIAYWPEDRSGDNISNFRYPEKVKPGKNDSGNYPRIHIENLHLYVNPEQVLPGINQVIPDVRALPGRGRDEYSS